jgi:hypothetical protein
MIEWPYRIGDIGIDIGSRSFAGDPFTISEMWSSPDSYRQNLSARLG